MSRAAELHKKRQLQRLAAQGGAVSFAQMGAGMTPDAAFESSFTVAEGAVAGADDDAAPREPKRGELAIYGNDETYNMNNMLYKSITNNEYTRALGQDDWGPGPLQFYSVKIIVHDILGV